MPRGLNEGGSINMGRLERGERSYHYSWLLNSVEQSLLTYRFGWRVQP